MDDTIFIPNERMKALKSKLESMNRKAEKLNLPCYASLTIHKDGIQVYEFDSKKYSVYGYYVTVSGLLPVIREWRVVAKIEHLPEGNFIHSFSEVPEIYRESAPKCESRGLATLGHTTADHHPRCTPAPSSAIAQVQCQLPRICTSELPPLAVRVWSGIRSHH